MAAYARSIESQPMETDRLGELVTLFDFATLACFLVMAGAFFVLTERRPRTLLRLLLSGIAFAVANQLGNAGYAFIGWILMIAGIGYAVMVVRHE